MERHQDKFLCTFKCHWWTNILVSLHVSDGAPGLFLPAAGGGLQQETGPSQQGGENWGTNTQVFHCQSASARLIACHVLVTDLLPVAFQPSVHLLSVMCQCCPKLEGKINLLKMLKHSFHLLSVMSSVQFKMVSVCLEKPICAPPRLSEISPMLPLKQFQCSPDWRWPSLVLSMKNCLALRLSMPLSFRRLVGWCP